MRCCPLGTAHFGHNSRKMNAARDTDHLLGSLEARVAQLEGQNKEQWAELKAVRHCQAVQKGERVSRRAMLATVISIAGVVAAMVAVGITVWQGG